MNKRELETRYKQAGLLYIMREFEDALDILDDLLRHLPGNKEILIAKVKCLVSMGFHAEANELCQQLLATCNDAHVAGILARLQKGNHLSHAC